MLDIPYAHKILQDFYGKKVPKPCKHTITLVGILRDSW